MRQVVARSLLQRLAMRLLLLLLQLLGQVSGHGLVEAGLVMIAPVSQLLRFTFTTLHPDRGHHGLDRRVPTLFQLVATHLCCRRGCCTGIICGVVGRCASDCSAWTRDFGLRAGSGALVGHTCWDGCFGGGGRSRAQGSAWTVEVFVLGGLAAQVAHRGGGWRFEWSVESANGRNAEVSGPRAGRGGSSAAQAARRVR